jgi:uncharacterized membrane protein
VPTLTRWLKQLPSRLGALGPNARFGLSLITAGIAVVALSRFPWAVRIIAGWGAMSATELPFMWWLIVRADPAQTRTLAETKHVSGRPAIIVAAVAAGLVSIALTPYVLHIARTFPTDTRVALVLLCMGAVFFMWLFAHTEYAAHYASLCCQPGIELRFEPGQEPDYLDFAYFAFTVGITSQVSDVRMIGRKLRRVVFGHLVISFAYNTAVVALAVDALLELRR